MSETDPTFDVGTLAERIADDLFTDGIGRKADRLVLTIEPRGKPHRRLGGWSEPAMRDRISRTIEQAITRPAKRPTKRQKAERR